MMHGFVSRLCSELLPQEVEREKKSAHGTNWKEIWNSTAKLSLAVETKPGVFSVKPLHATVQSQHRPEVPFANMCFRIHTSVYCVVFTVHSVSPPAPQSPCPSWLRAAPASGRGEEGE